MVATELNVQDARPLSLWWDWVFWVGATGFELVSKAQSLLAPTCGR